ncbi:transglycosylase domain-containing protein [Actinoallomurus vinaceus]|uniref:transglycosylase domain-containing protein n=1 Tax=Actinoallomurus vinaceus TaxID=1080074 RepID=UPI0031EBBBEB
MGVAYSMVTVPKINADVQAQGTTIYWGDKTKNPTVMGRLGATRQMLPSLTKVSQPMQAAALAAEDRNFYHEAAISPTGIGRAVYNNLTGGDTQGGSTITQQYVKNAYLTQNRTFTRKFKEIFIAVKVNKQNSKDQILLNYLNTIFFGAPVEGNEGAYSVESAARIWFGTTAEKLTIPQAALLGANIKWPGHYTPLSKGPQLQATMARYNWVLQGMRTIGKISDADVARYQNHLPPVHKAKGSGWQGQNGYVLERVRQALLSMKGIDQTKIMTGGLKVYTSWDPDLQQKAAAVVKQRLRSMPSDTRVGVVTIDAKTGEVKAAYGGKDFTKRSVDDAYFSTAQIGSSIKPFVLTAAVKEGIGIKSMMSAKGPVWVNTSGDTSPVKAPGFTARFSNDEGDTDKVVSLVDATAESYNTVYVPLGFKAKWQNVLKVAEDAGLPRPALLRGHPGEGGFFLGQSDMRPLDLATGYTTLANDGKFIVPHSIRRVEDSQHKTIVEPPTSGKQVIDSDIIHDVQYAMQAVVQKGTGKNAQLTGREVAGKTGTTNDNYSAWFSGFTPPTTGSKPKQYVTTVGMWRYVDKVPKGKHKHGGYFKKLQNVGGYGHINGGDLPALIWHDYMTQALDGMTTGSFPPPAYHGDKQLYATPSPTATTPTPSTTPTCKKNQIPDIDHCQPSQPTDPTGPPNPKYCKHHPMDPRCGNQSPTPDPTNTCRNIMGCPSTPTDPGGPPNGQGRAARPFRE